MDPAGNVAYHILKQLQDNVDKYCLVVNNQSVTREKFHEKLTAAINLLKWKGFSPNNRVLVTIQPSIEFYAVAIAVLAIGGILVLIDPSMGLERCNYCIATAKPNIWVWERGSKLRFLKYVLPSFRSIPTHLEIGGLDLSATSKELFAPEEVEPVENALATFTTGSTGMPKLMLRKHSFLLNQSNSMSLSFELMVKNELDKEENEVVFSTNLPVFPLHYLKVGATCVLFPSIDKTSPPDAFKIMKKHEVTGLLGSPAFAEKLALYAQKNKITLPVQYVAMGGAPVYKKTLRTVSSNIPGRMTMVAYGSTEAEPITAIFAEEKMELERGDREGLCVGKPVFSGTVKVIQLLHGPVENPVNITQDYEIPPYQIGEILISGWHVNTYQVTKDRLVTDIGGKIWLRIEDAGYLDDEGRVWLVGRVKWMVEREGRRYWSTIIEQKLLDRCSLITFATYICHSGEAWLFLEAPSGLPVKEEAGIKSYLSREGIPVDHMRIMKAIPKDRRHRSKPDTGTLFKRNNPNSPFKILQFAMRANPLLSILVVILQLFFIMIAIIVIFSQ